MPGTEPRRLPGIRPVGRFPASQRVRKRSEFQEIQSSGRRVTTDHFVLLLRARRLESPFRSARIGLTVSRKVGNAVLRNRAKRLLREAFRATRDLWADDLDLVVIVKRASRDLGLEAVVRELRGAARLILRRAHQARRDREKLASELARDD